MKHIQFKFPSAVTDVYFDHRFSALKKIVDQASTIIITDQHVHDAQQKLFKGWNVIVLKPGEEHKVQGTVDALIEQLIEMQADRKTTLVGVGGGVITDLTGYVASIYMRGLAFGFVPTSILGLVDASIGGKNGVDVGVYKNLVGVIRQPKFILHDLTMLNTLPQAEWENGFAEIVKHACIKDEKMFVELEGHQLSTYQQLDKPLKELIQRNAVLKIKVVQGDEFEKGDRRLLNFGHTLGHALENQYELMHGQAIAIGMTTACHISGQLTGFKHTSRVVNVLEKFGLPTYANFNKEKVFAVLKMDKKRVKKEMNYVLLERIGKGVVRTIALNKLEKLIAN